MPAASATADASSIYAVDRNVDVNAPAVRGPIEAGGSDVVTMAMNANPNVNADTNANAAANTNPVANTDVEPAARAGWLASAQSWGSGVANNVVAGARDAGARVSTAVQSGVESARTTVVNAANDVGARASSAVSSAVASASASASSAATSTSNAIASGASNAAESARAAATSAALGASSTIPIVAQGAADFGEGFIEPARELADMAVSAGSAAAEAAWKATGALRGAPEETQEVADGAKALATSAWDGAKQVGTNIANSASRGTLADDAQSMGASVLATAGVVKDALVAPYQKAIDEGRPMKAVGRATFEVASALVGTKGVDKVARGASTGATVTRGLTASASTAERAAIAASSTERVVAAAASAERATAASSSARAASTVDHVVDLQSAKGVGPGAENAFHGLSSPRVEAVFGQGPYPPAVIEHLSDPGLRQLALHDPARAQTLYEARSWRSMESLTAQKGNRSWSQVADEVARERPLVSREGAYIVKEAPPGVGGANRPALDVVVDPAYDGGAIYQTLTRADGSKVTTSLQQPLDTLARALPDGDLSRTAVLNTHAAEAGGFAGASIDEAADMMANQIRWANMGRTPEQTIDRVALVACYQADRVPWTTGTHAQHFAEALNKKLAPYGLEVETVASKHTGPISTPASGPLNANRQPLELVRAAEQPFALMEREGNDIGQAVVAGGAVTGAAVFLYNVVPSRK